MEYKVNDCDCQSCKSMCKISPCFPTPEQVLDYESKGMMSFFQPTAWVDAEAGIVYSLLAPKSTDGGTVHNVPLRTCIFFTTNELCYLHNIDLKPMEGKLANHDMGSDTSLRRGVCQSWLTEKGKTLLAKYSDSAFCEDVINTQKILNKLIKENTNG